LDHHIFAYQASFIYEKIDDASVLYFQHKKKIPAGRQKFLSKFQQLHTRFLNKSVTIVLDQSHIVEWVTAVPTVKHYQNLPYWNSISHISCNSIWSHIWFHKYFSNYKNI